MDRKLYTVRQVAAMLSLSRTATYQLITSGQLRSVKIGASRRVPATAIDEFLSTLLTQSA